MTTIESLDPGQPGEVGEARRRWRPAVWPGLLIALGVGSFGAAEPLRRWANADEAHEWALLMYLVLPVVGVVLAVLGIVLSATGLLYTSGRVLLAFARRPAPLLAARRLVADPWSGSRFFGLLLVFVFLAGGMAWVRSWLATQELARQQFCVIVGPGPGCDDSLNQSYARTVDLIDLAVMVGVVLTATGMLIAVVVSAAKLAPTGVPRRVLARSVLWQAVVSTIPAMFIALAVGTGLMRSFAREAVGGKVDDNEVSVAIPVPWGELARDGGIAAATVLLAAVLALLVLRPNTDVRETHTV